MGDRVPSTNASNVSLKSNVLYFRWTKTGEKPVAAGKTIADVMNDGYVNKKYGFGKDQKICWDASKNIMKNADRHKRSC